MIFRRTENNDFQMTLSPQKAKVIKIAVITALSLGAIAGGALALYFLLPQFGVGQLSVLKYGINYFGRKTVIGEELFTSIQMSSGTLIRNTILLAAAGAAIGLGGYGLAKQLKNVLDLIKGSVAKKLKNKDDSSEEDSKIKRNARNLFVFMQKTSEFFNYIKGTKLGRVVKVAIIVGTFAAGAIMLSLSSYYFLNLLQNCALSGGYAVFERSLQLALVGLVAGGALGSVGSLLLLKEVFAKKRKKAVSLEAENVSSRSNSRSHTVMITEGKETSESSRSEIED